MASVVTYTIDSNVEYDVYVPENVSSDTPILVYSCSVGSIYDQLSNGILNSGINAIVIVPKPKYWLPYKDYSQVVSTMVNQVREDYSIQPAGYIANGFSQQAYTAIKTKVYDLQDNPDCGRQLILLNDGVPLRENEDHTISEMLTQSDIDVLEQNNAFIVDYCQNNKWQNVGQLLLNSSLDILFISNENLPYSGFWANHDYIYSNSYTSGLYADVLSFFYDGGDLPDDGYTYRLYNHETKQLEEYTASEIKEKLNLTLEEFQQLHHGAGVDTFRIKSVNSPVCEEYSSLKNLANLSITSRDGREISSSFIYVSSSMNEIRNQVKNTSFLNNFQNIQLRSSSGIPGCISGYLNAYFDLVGSLMNSISLETESIVSYAQAIVDLDENLAQGIISEDDNSELTYESEEKPTETTTTSTKPTTTTTTSSSYIPTVSTGSAVASAIVSTPVSQEKEDIYEFDGFKGSISTLGNKIQEAKFTYSFSSPEEASQKFEEIKEKYKDCDYIKEIRLNGSEIEVIFDEEAFEGISKEEFVEKYFQDGKLIEDNTQPVQTTQTTSNQNNQQTIPYTTNVTASGSWGIEPHSHVTAAERQRRIQLLGGPVGTPEEQLAKMKTIKVPYWDGSSVQEMNLTVNAAIADKFYNAFQELTDMHYTVIPSCTGVYNYRDGNTDHALGSALDINWQHNFYSGDGSEYSIRGREDVIEVFAKQGFYWGGDWSSSKVDDMHFTFAGY